MTVISDLSPVRPMHVSRTERLPKPVSGADATRVDYVCRGIRLVVLGMLILAASAARPASVFSQDDNAFGDFDDLPDPSGLQDEDPFVDDQDSIGDDDFADPEFGDARDGGDEFGSRDDQPRIVDDPPADATEQTPARDINPAGTAPETIEPRSLPRQTSQPSLVESIQSSHDAAFELMVGQGRLLTLRERISDRDKPGVIAVGDPSVIEFQVLPNPRLIRILGIRPGVTDLSITTADDRTISFTVRVQYDLTLLEARLRQVFPSAKIKLAQLRDHLIVEGQARSTSQAERIVETLTAFLASMQAETEQQQARESVGLGGGARGGAGEDDDTPAIPDAANQELGGIQSTRVQVARATVINLLRVPGLQQVLLKVRIAELNRTALREVGADILGVDPDSGNIVGTRIGGAAVSASGVAGLGGLLGSATGDLGNSSTAFGIFPSGDFQIILRALRENGFLRVLAEPNLIAMSGHRANFLAGGEFPVPVPQATGVGGGNSVTVDFREFGVRLDFLPYVIEDGRIRLSVTPEVSTIDFSLGTTLVVGGNPVPGLNTRRANTTVELNQGQTLAIAGLLQVELDGRTNRIPGLGDLPYLGPLFSNSTHRRVEKELVVLVTPYLVDGVDGGDGFPLPGDSLQDPTDEEFYLGNKIEGEWGVGHRATVDYGYRHPGRLIRYEKHCISGPVGFSQ